MNAKTAHRKIYEQIPTFECITGCTDCCGPVPVSRYEAQKLGIKNATLTPTEDGCIRCQYATDQGCSVYDRRPFMCRLFGAVDNQLLTCPHGKGPKKKLTEQRARELASVHVQYF